MGAAHVRASMMRYFDSKEMELPPSHIMASGALPPAFPAVRIDGELYLETAALPIELAIDADRGKGGRQRPDAMT